RRRDVDVGHVRRPAAGRVEPEAARVGEEIQDAAAPGDPPDEEAVLALIEERARLLPVRQVHDGGDAVLLDADHVWRGRSVPDLEADALSLLRAARDDRPHSQVLEAGADRVDEIVEARRGRLAVDLDDG